MAVEITEDFVWQVIPPRPRESHKGTFGTVLAVAGSASYRGAALLAAEGALRTGAGIVTLASVEPVLAAAAARLPECCLCPCAAGADGGISPESIPFIQRQKATVLLLGPGLGGTAQSAARAAETRVLVQRLLPGFAGSAVLDADGLNAAAQLLAEGKALPHPMGELILTPHPGEMARLTGLSVAEISADREKIARQYAQCLTESSGASNKRHFRSGSTEQFSNQSRFINIVIPIFSNFFKVRNSNGNIHFFHLCCSFRVATHRLFIASMIP